MSSSDTFKMLAEEAMASEEFGPLSDWLEEAARPKAAQFYRTRFFERFIILDQVVRMGIEYDEREYELFLNYKKASGLPEVFRPLGLPDGYPSD